MSTKVNRLKRNGAGYPESFNQIASPPKEIFWLGSPFKQWHDRPKIAIVGSRKISAYGRQVTDQLATELAQLGFVIISGLAYGVDSIAHEATLKAGGLTVAVLGTPAEEIYPAGHVSLTKRILNQSGAIISEYPKGSPGFPGNFIARNRLVSALADGLLITEAAVNSGSLHTARFALEQGKVVMAVPGNINSPTSEGTNNLIKSGALPVTEVADILLALNIKPQANKERRAFAGSEDEQKVLKLIRSGISDQEELATKAGLDGAAIGSALTILEINGYIKPGGGGNWLSV